MKADLRDPCVGPCLEFRVLGPPPQPDVSVVPATMVPNPVTPNINNNNNRAFTFGEQGQMSTPDNYVTSYDEPGKWGIATTNDTANNKTACTINAGTIGNGNDDAKCQLVADFGRISAAPGSGTAETWTLANGDAWDHPIHIHFEEAQIIRRNGYTNQVPAWEGGRKDVFRLHADGASLTLFIQFRDWGGMFMEHCHNTMHEDNAMLLRWEINDARGVFVNPLPTPIPQPTGVTFEPPDEILAGALPPYDSLTNGKPGGG
jgi:manganese oxidase